MKKLLLLPVFLLTLACQESGPSKPLFSDTLPKSNGGRLDIIVVAEEPTWSEVGGEKFQKYFTQPQVGLPQAEPIFTVRQIPPVSFNSLLQRSRNIIEMKYGETGITVEENKYARPQLYITISAPDDIEMAKLVLSNYKDLINRIHTSEAEYLQKQVTADPQPLPTTFKKHNFSMKIPASFKLETEQKNLAVFWNKSLKSDQGILVYFEPLDESETLLGEDIIPLRDSLTTIHVPGDREGSYMIVEDYIPPVFETMKIDGNFAIETRGLWRTKGDFMGGSFISYTIYDETNNQKIMVDAFLYAPELKKRNLVLELEAILRTADITN